MACKIEWRIDFCDTVLERTSRLHMKEHEAEHALNQSANLANQSSTCPLTASKPNENKSEHRLHFIGTKDGVIKC